MPGNITNKERPLSLIIYGKAEACDQRGSVMMSVPLARLQIHPSGRTPWAVFQERAV